MARTRTVLRTLPAARRREQGSALFIAVMMLVLMGGLGFVALEKVGTDRQVAGFQNRSLASFYAAEAGVAEGRSLVSAVGTRSQTPNFPDIGAAVDLGDTALYDREGSLPRYYGDPEFAPDFIQYKADGGTASGTNLQWGKQKLVTTLWQINVVGESPGQSRTRLEVVEVKVLSQGY